jgi:predicted ATP-grasp superfamily ATP-dependent carboligase
MDIVRPLAMAGVRSWVMAQSGQPMRYSRFVDGVIEYADPWEASEQLVDRLLSFAKQQPFPPVLYYENDGYLAAISRYRNRLCEAFQCVLPSQLLVDDLQDKRRFAQLSVQLGLPTPRSWVINGMDELRRLNLSLPVIVKPLTRYDRDNAWLRLGGTAKAIRLSSTRDVENLELRLDTSHLALLVQELVPGPESRVESYHVYARRPGEVSAHFMGRKIRTWPADFGHSTALITTDASDVEQLGRDVVRILELSGVAKLDFKRDGEGRLHLLEVNPRFTLWNHLGAVAGVNIPALVYADLTGTSGRRHVPRARPGVTWCDVPKDFRAARSASIGIADWATWVARSNIKTDWAFDDPMPFIRGRLLRAAVKRLRFMRKFRATV